MAAKLLNCFRVHANVRVPIVVLQCSQRVTLEGDALEAASVAKQNLEDVFNTNLRIRAEITITGVSQEEGC
jgi:hypothetical protein